MNNILIRFIIQMHHKLYKSKRKHKILEFFYNLIIQLVYNGYLPVTAELGDNILFPHGLNGIFISGSAKIGNNCVIYQHVTIGRGNGGAPIIKDNTIIGAGAKIIGPITIGEHCRIGAGTSVSTDIPDNHTVVMPKPRMISKVMGDQR